MSAQPLYRQLLGTEFDRLPAALRRFHGLQGRHVLTGSVHVAAPATPLAGWIARCLGAPLHAARGGLRFELDAGPRSETWTRRFPHRTMASRLAVDGPHLVERLGWATLRFVPDLRPDGLALRLAGLRVLGLPCPRALWPVIEAVETGEGARLHFRIEAGLPLVGRVARYTGHLDLPPGDSP